MNTDPLTRDELRAIARLGHDETVSLRLAGAPLTLTASQAAEMLWMLDTSEGAHDLASRMRFHLRIVLNDQEGMVSTS